MRAVRSADIRPGRDDLVDPVEDLVAERDVGGGSALEHGPADVVAQPLVVEDELANRVRELVSLPLALEPPRRLAFAVWRGSPNSLDRVCGGTQIVSSDVPNAGCLPGGVGGMTGGTPQVLAAPMA